MQILAHNNFLANLCNMNWRVASANFTCNMRCSAYGFGPSAAEPSQLNLPNPFLARRRSRLKGGADRHHTDSPGARRGWHGCGTIAHTGRSVLGTFVSGPDRQCKCFQSPKISRPTLAVLPASVLVPHNSPTDISSVTRVPVLHHSTGTSRPTAAVLPAAGVADSSSLLEPMNRTRGQ
jgi:hypothetical protein